METDVLVIGGGPAGMSSALSASRNGSKVILVERDKVLGGILNQCIHNGFGLHYFNEELTGPEFAHRFRKMVEKDKNITVLTDTLVTEIGDHKVSVMGKNGVFDIKCKALIIAMGCRERTAGNISLNGTRPMGILTAGTVQKMVNIDGKMVGKDIVILGSGDIGLIMARRLTLEGAKVHAVLEINSTSSGLKRNILQCLDDFNIPLYFNTTIFDVVGKDRVEGVYYGQVDEHFNHIENTSKFLKCDTVVLSVGLIPEMQMGKGVSVNPKTNGAFVNEHYQTEKEWIFSCGNILHVHDLVDNVALEGKQVGLFASLYAQKKLNNGNLIKVSHSADFAYVLPYTLFEGEEEVEVKFRLKKKVVKSFIVAISQGNIIAKKYVLAGVPGEMMTFKFSKKGVKEEIVFEVRENGKI